MRHNKPIHAYCETFVSCAQWRGLRHMSAQPYGLKMGFTFSSNGTVSRLVE
jgi:hypothetical protein